MINLFLIFPSRDRDYVPERMDLRNQLSMLCTLVQYQKFASWKIIRANRCKLKDIEGRTMHDCTRLVNKSDQGIEMGGSRY